MEKQEHILDPEAMGKRIKERRTLLHFSIEQLAEQTELSPRYLQELESGRRCPSLKTADLLAHCLNMTVDFLLHGAQEEDTEASSLEDLVRSCPPGQVENLERLVAVFLRPVAEAAKEAASRNTSGEEASPIRFSGKERLDAEPSVAENRSRKK